ncbi:cytochrome P450 [Nocardioides sp. QY071]|uniref:cytochrome P450 n=1 Tax=Nocardioides sp. QY071 TaxID=3044187 RepID=UPI002499BA8A|nr:cytochrome P450 [Nocardioides sp. QY071]WGY02831.1 cytochrome P450 [Nocardioides sp. QY071]
MTLADIPEVSTVLDDQGADVPALIKGTGHLPEMRVDPIALFHRVREECGEVGRFRLADKQVVLVTGAEANEAFFRAPDDVLDQAAAYPFMTPIFGKGVVFDASPEERQQMLKNQALRGDMMRGHAQTIEAEIRRMVADWGDEGEIDLLDFFAELTIYTTSSCLIGKPFREQLDGSFAEVYHRLEHGTDAIAYVDPHADIDSFRIRDEAREELVAKVQAIIAARIARAESMGGEIPKQDRDLLDVLIAVGYDAEMVTGIFISMMFAGHHTSSGTASWAMIELLRNPSVMDDVVAELDALYADGSEVSFQALRSIPVLEAALKETLRLHPPLVILMRLVQEDFDLLGRTIPAGTVLAASPRVSNRIEADFPKADSFDPGRYVDPRQEDLQNRWTWIPFGAGKHRCVGNAFAMMQMKAIFSVILRDFTFEPVQELDSYRDDFTKMVIQLAQPARVRYRRRASR